jgi:hypothetical protein
MPHSWDDVLGVLALTSGYVRLEQWREALDVQERDASRRHLGDILVELRAITRQQLDELLREQQRIKRGLTSRMKRP